MRVDYRKELSQKFGKYCEVYDMKVPIILAGAGVCLVWHCILAIMQQVHGL
jgi:hypothetical protein